MTYQKTLQIIMGIAIAGILFSGYLSYLELFAPTGCSTAIVSCGNSGFTLANLPACVYGFLMYLIIFGLTLFSLLKNKKSEDK